MKQKRIAIIGAGFAGRSIAAELINKKLSGKVIVFFDDDSSKAGTQWQGIPVDGPVDSITVKNKTLQIDEAIIAIPSGTNEQLKRIYRLLEQANIPVIKLLPKLSQIIEGDAHLVQTRHIKPEDILGRTPVVIGLRESISYLRGNRVLVTGAGGSIGSEIARQLLSGGADRLYLFGHGENSIYAIEHELRLLQDEGVGEKATIVPVIGELQDERYMDFLLKRLKADVIFHCAAYKHVPMSEENPVQTIQNNVFGTRNLVNSALKNNVPRFVLISTDKAASAASVYGVSKSICESIVLDARCDHHDYLTVRFGNVLASRGSIIPLFRKQILNGGPVTVTDKRATRYFMTIPEAVSLVLKTGGLGKGGRQYILDMGEAININDIAEQMIRFYGYVPHEEIRIIYSGLREGEKLHETLWNDNESAVPTAYEKILQIQTNGTQIPLPELLAKLRDICYFNSERSDAYRNRRMLRSTLKSYYPQLKDKTDEPPY